MKTLPPEQDLLLAGYMALSGAAALAQEEYACLCRRLPQEFLQKTIEASKRLGNSIRTLPSYLAAGTKTGASACFALGAGGLFNGLWYMAEAWQAGFAVDLEAVPMRQETVEICEILKLNPYYLYSADSFLIAARHGERLCRELRKQGWPAAVIGTLSEGNQKILLHGAAEGCLNRPREDERERFLKRKREGGRKEGPAGRAASEGQEGEATYA